MLILHKISGRKQNYDEQKQVKGLQKRAIRSMWEIRWNTTIYQKNCSQETVSVEEVIHFV